MKTSPSRIALPCSKSVEFLNVSEIVRFEGFQNYSKVFLRNGKMILSTNNLGSYKEELENSGFFCCHKSHLINLSLVDRYIKEGYVIMSDNSNVPISRRKKTEFLNRVLYNLEHNPKRKRLEPITKISHSVSA